MEREEGGIIDVNILEAVWLSVSKALKMCSVPPE